MMKRSCKNCLWFDKCPESEACDNYDPVDTEEAEEIDVAEYADDLRSRHKYYQAHVFEQNE